MDSVRFDPATPTSTTPQSSPRTGAAVWGSSLTDITRFHPKSATDQELREITDLLNAGVPIDRPGSPETPHETWAAYFTADDTDLEARTFWTARDAERLLAVLIACEYLEQDLHLIRAELHVHPEVRRRGTGSAALRVLIDDARKSGRTHIESLSLLKGGAGESWALARGFRSTLGTVTQRLDVSDAARAMWDVPTPDGYRVRTWSGPVPDELLESFARARQAIADAPHGDGSWSVPAWTPELVRKTEAETAAHHIETRTAVAVHEATGEVAAFTVLMVLPGVGDSAKQDETAVLGPHRGRGLGHVVKAANLRRLLADRPAIERVVTRTADDNPHMQRVNCQVGFVTIRGTIDVEGAVADIERRLDAMEDH